MSDQEAERIIDNRVMARLKTDMAYLRASNAEEQAEREAEITQEEEANYYASRK